MRTGDSPSDSSQLLELGQANAGGQSAVDRCGTKAVLETTLNYCHLCRHLLGHVNVVVVPLLGGF
jgi:hypothetical protein